MPHFLTFTVVGWIDVFSRKAYRDILLEGLQFCIENKGMKLHAWVIMSNHIHLIISTEENKIEHLVRDLKKFTSKQIINSIIESHSESRKEWMINLFKFAGSHNNNNTTYQFWKQDYHPIELNTVEKLKQRLEYLRDNPVRAGLVRHAEEFMYSSAVDYLTTRKGLLVIDKLWL